MNRIEMLLELKKNPAKIFESQNDGIMYGVKKIDCVEKVVCWAETQSFEEACAEVDYIKFNDKTEYTEIIKPLWEVIEDGEWFYCIDFYCENGVSYDVFDGNYECDIRNKENHNMFRTEEEAKAKAKELLEILKK